jgi:hypothetical protein
MDEEPDLLTINQSGVARYQSFSNIETPEHPEIGFYEKQLNPKEVEIIERGLVSSTLRSLPDHWGQVLPGDRFQRVRATFGTEKIEKLIGTKRPVAPGLRAVLEELDRIVAVVRTQPRRVLRSTLAAAKLIGGGVIEAKLSLSNRGTDVVLCRNPADLVGAPDGQLAFEFWPDRSSSDIEAQGLLSVPARDVVPDQLPAGVRGQDEILEIPANASVSFQVRAKRPAQAGGLYFGRLIYRTTAKEIRGRSPLVGELLSNSVKVTLSSEG